MKTINRVALVAGALLASAASTQAAQAAVLLVNVTGVQTFDAFGDTSNTVNSYNIGAGSTVTSLAFNLTIATIGASYLSEASIYYTNTAKTLGVVFRPGIADTRTGTATYTGTSDLVALGLSFSVGADGLLRLEYAESFDDNPNLPDATITAGSLSFTYTPVATGSVPEPASWALLISGFGLVGGAMRRRQATVAFA